jgi:hypothetical protein
MLIFYQTTWRHILDDTNDHSHFVGNTKLLPVLLSAISLFAYVLQFRKLLQVEIGTANYEGCGGQWSWIKLRYYLNFLCKLCVKHILQV